MIPKVIWTIWLNDKDEIPELIQKCTKTHEVLGYERRFITLNNLPQVDSRYFKECLEAKKWVKAVDYLRIWLLNENGGIYLDADVEVLKPFGAFDAFLDNKIFACEEANGFVSNAVIGAEAKHPLLKNYLETVDGNFIGGGSLIYQPGMFLWTEMAKQSPDVKIYPTEYFLPYNWQADTMKVTEKTVTIHYFNRSWTKK